jgi:hypothetical protein
MADIAITTYTNKTYKSGASTVVPGFVEGSPGSPINPPGSGATHNPVTIGSPANGLSITDDQVLTYDGSTIPTAAVIGRYEIDTSGTTAPVGTKDIRYNNATQISATQLFISDITEDNIDVDLFLSLIKQGSALVIQDRDDHLNYQTYEVSGTPTFASATWTFPVTFKDSGGTGTTNFANNHKVLLSALSSGSGTIGGSGTANYVARFTGASTIGNSQIIDNGTNVLINKTVDNGNKLQLNGNLQISSGDIITDNLRGLYYDNDNRVRIDSGYGWEISSWSKTLFKKNVEIENQIYSPVNAKGNSGSGTVTFNWNDSNIQSVTLTGNCTFAFSNPQSGASYQIIVSQDGTGGRVVTLPSVTWQGGSSPSLPTGINNQYLLRFYYNGSAYFGELVGYYSGGGFITDAPSDGKYYTRRNGTWLDLPLTRIVVNMDNNAFSLVPASGLFGAVTEFASIRTYRLQTTGASEKIVFASISYSSTTFNYGTASGEIKFRLSSSLNDVFPVGQVPEILSIQFRYRSTLPLVTTIQQVTFTAESGNQSYFTLLKNVTDPNDIDSGTPFVVTDFTSHASATRNVFAIEMILKYT